MIAAPIGSKLVFTVLLHRHPPGQYSRLRQRKLERIYPNPDRRERYREEFNTSYPANHRYNDIAGYAEIYWDAGTRILVEIFFRGDRTTKFGKAVSAGPRPELFSANRFYPLYEVYEEAGQFSDASCGGGFKRQAIEDGLEHVRTVATGMGCFVDLTHEKLLLDALDIDRLLCVDRGSVEPQDSR